MRTTYKTLALSLIAISVLSACGDDKEEKKAPTQVVARVNDKEITVHQLNYLLKNRPQADNETKQRALEVLIDQELLVQKAEELKLDRDPGVLQTIEQSKRQILSQAAAEKLAGATGNVTPAQITDFYNKNPLLFSQRKIYVFDAFAVPKDKLTPDLEKELNSVKSAAETASVLTAKGLEAKSGELKRPAEQLPRPVLAKLGTMNPGDILIQPEGERVVLLQLREAAAAPVTEAQAEPVIKRYLTNTNRGEAIQTNVKSLRTAAKVEYVQKFSDKPQASAAASAPAPAPAPAATEGNDHLKEGLKGLK